MQVRTFQSQRLAGGKENFRCRKGFRMACACDAPGCRCIHQQARPELAIFAPPLSCSHRGGLHGVFCWRFRVLRSLPPQEEPPPQSRWSSRRHASLSGSILSDLPWRNAHLSPLAWSIHGSGALFVTIFDKTGERMTSLIPSAAVASISYGRRHCGCCPLPQGPCSRSSRAPVYTRYTKHVYLCRATWTSAPNVDAALLAMQASGIDIGILVIDAQQLAPR